MAVSQLETIVICTLMFFTMRLFVKIHKKWNSKRMNRVIRDFLWTDDEADRALSLAQGTERPIQPNGAMYYTRGPIVNISNDEPRQITQQEFDPKEFGEVFRKNCSAGDLDLHQGKDGPAVGIQMRRKNYGARQFERSGIAEKEPASSDEYSNYPEGENTGRIMEKNVSFKEFKPVGRLTKYRYVSMDGRTEKPTQYLYTNMEGRGWNVPIPCKSCQTKGSNAKECLRRDISHMGLEPLMGRLTARSKPTRTGWHPNWANVANKNRSQMANRNRAAPVAGDRSVPKCKNRSAPANKKRANILKNTGAGRPGKKERYAFLNLSYPNTSKPEPSTSGAKKGAVSGGGRKL